MSKMVQIRNMPEPMHRKLKSRAASMGMSLSDYLLSEIKKIADHPTFDELRERMSKIPPITEDLDVVGILREERDSR